MAAYTSLLFSILFTSMVSADVIVCPESTEMTCESLCCDGKQNFQNNLKNCDYFGFSSNLHADCRSKLQAACNATIAPVTASCACGACDMEPLNSSTPVIMDPSFEKLLCAIHEQLSEYDDICTTGSSNNTALAIGQFTEGASIALGFNATEVEQNTEPIPCSSSVSSQCAGLCCSADETYREVVKNCDSFAFVPDLFKGCVNDLQKKCLEGVLAGYEPLAAMGVNCDCDFNATCDLGGFSAEDSASLDEMLMKLICRLHLELENYPQTCDKYSDSSIEISISFMLVLAALVF